jgi:hypothetical protein
MMRRVRSRKFVNEEALAHWGPLRQKKVQSTAPLQLKRFKVGSKMAIAASAPVLPNQKKQFCKIA